MKNDNSVVEKRLQNLKKYYLKAGELIDGLPEAIPESTRNFLKEKISGDKDLTELMDLLDEALQKSGEGPESMDVQLDEAIKKVAWKLTAIFSALAAGVAVTPIPISDIYILLVLQSLLVGLIASLSGRDVSLETAKEFILSIGGVVGAGYTFRLIAQQGAKLVNLIWPGIGSAVSSAVAAVGTTAIGKAAVLYYIDGNDLSTAKLKFEEIIKEKLQKKEELEDFFEE